MSRIIKRFQKRVVVNQDARINATSELLNGILAVKTFTWEDSFENRIKKLRLEEHRNMLKWFYIRAFNFAMFSYILSIMILVTFSTIVLRGKSFDLANSIYIITLLQNPILNMTLIFPIGKFILIMKLMMK